MGLFAYTDRSDSMFNLEGVPYGGGFLGDEDSALRCKASGLWRKKMSPGTPETGSVHARNIDEAGVGLARWSIVCLKISAQCFVRRGFEIRFFSSQRGFQGALVDGKAGSVYV